MLVNRQQFQAGNLLVSYLPHARYNGFKYELHNKTYGMTARTGVPRVNLDLMDATRATMNVPYASPYVYYNLLTKEGTIGDFTISVYSPLTDVSGSGRVGVKVYARFVDVDLQFPTGQTVVTTAASPPPSVSGVFGNLITRAQRLNVGDASSKLAELKDMKQQLTNAIRDFRTLTNHSNDMAVTGFKQKALPNMATSDGANETHIISLNTSNSLTPMNMGETSTSEMSFQKILNIPNYHTFFPITTSQVAGTEVWREIVNPMVLPNATGLNLPPNTNMYDYLAFVSNPFSLWRGPIKYNFRAVKTTFHSVRLRVGWSPVTTANAVIDRDACYTEIVDLKDRNQFTFEVPYVFPQSWLSVRSSPSLPHFCGVIFIDVENQMVAPDTVSNAIDIIVERAAGDGYELNLPTRMETFPIDPRLTETTRRTTVTPPPPKNMVKPAVVAHENPYAVPVTQEEERFSIDAYDVNERDLSYFGALGDDMINKAKELLAAGKTISSQVMTVINDMAIYKHQVLPSYFTMQLDQLISLFEKDGGATDMFTQLPQGILMRKRDAHSNSVCVVMEGGGCAKVDGSDMPDRDMSTLANHSNGNCENFDQDVMRNISIDITFTRPPPALQADNYTLGSSVNNVLTMIKRSSRLHVNGRPTKLRPLHIQPHAFSPISFNPGTPGSYIRPALDNLSYFASIYTFARGGVGIRLLTQEQPYSVIADPSLSINLLSTDKLTPAQVAKTDWTDNDTYWISNEMTHAINPQVEGFGEFLIPFYSQTYCQAYDMRSETNPYVDNSVLQQPKTHLIVVPYQDPPDDAIWEAYRHASHDFEFSMLSGAPIMVSTTVANPTP